MCSNRSFRYFFLFLLFSFRLVFSLVSRFNQLGFLILTSKTRYIPYRYRYVYWDLESGAQQKRKKAKLKSIERQSEKERKIFKCRMQQRFNFWALLMKIYYCRNMSIYLSCLLSFWLIDDLHQKQSCQLEII